MLGINTLGNTPIFNYEDYGNTIETAIFNTLLDEPRAKRRYLAVIDVRNKDTQSVETLYTADGAYISEPSDTPSNTYFEPRLTKPFTFNRSMQEALIGRTGRSIGNVEASNADGFFDTYTDISKYAWDGQTIKIYLGKPDWDFSDFGKIFEGPIKAVPEFTRTKTTIKLRDVRSRLNKAIQDNLFPDPNDSGTIETNQDIQDDPKPLCYGKVNKATPVLIDRGKNIYQIHDDSTKGPHGQGVQDRGVILTDEGEVNDITSASPSSSAFVYERSSTNTGTFIRLGSIPDGIITADWQGDDTGSGYIDSVGDIIERIIKNRGGLTDSEINSESLENFKQKNNFTSGIYVKDKTQISAVVNEFVKSVFGFWGTDREGLFDLGSIQKPISSPTKSFDDGDILDVKRLEVQPPISRFEIAYQRNFTPLNLEQIAGSVSDSEVTFLQQEYRSFVKEPLGVETDHPLARDLGTVQTLLENRSDADKIATRITDLLSQSRERYRVTLKTQPFILQLNQIIELTSNRFNLSNGKKFFIQALTENAKKNQVEVVVFG